MQLQLPRASCNKPRLEGSSTSTGLLESTRGDPPPLSIRIPPGCFCALSTARSRLMNVIRFRCRGKEFEISSMVLSVSFRARSNDEVVVVVVARGKEKRRES